jgi:hypothetical protein
MRYILRSLKVFHLKPQRNKKKFRLQRYFHPGFKGYFNLEKIQSNFT